MSQHTALRLCFIGFGIVISAVTAFAAQGHSH